MSDVERRGGDGGVDLQCLLLGSEPESLVIPGSYLNQIRVGQPAFDKGFRMENGITGSNMQKVREPGIFPPNNAQEPETGEVQAGEKRRGENNTYTNIKQTQRQIYEYSRDD